MNTKTAAASKAPAKKIKAPVAAKPAAKPFADRGEREDDVELVPETAVQLIPLQLLGRAPENVRHTRSNEDVVELADDIGAHGLLQSLIGYQDPDQDIFPKGYTWIVGGGRRLQALELLRDRGAIGEEYRVPVLVRDAGEAVELSLSENLARRDMSPADEFEAFATLMKPGNVSAADLAKRFGFTERYVKERLRLSALIPEILEAIRERKITLDAAMAYARSSDPDLQRQVFEKQERANWEKHEPRRITTDYSSAFQNTGSGLFSFVGAEAYEAAGGGYEDDLLGNALYGEHRNLTNGVLLSELGLKSATTMARAALPKLQKDQPAVIDILVPGGVRVGGYPPSWPKTPKGFEKVDLGYGDRDAQWQRFADAGGKLIAIAGIDMHGEFEVSERSLFLDKETHKKLTTEQSRNAAPRLSEAEIEAERAAARRQAGVELHAWRLAAAKGMGLVVGRGRMRWPDGDWVNRTSHATGGRFVALQVFVPDADYQASLPGADAGYDDFVAEQKAAGEVARQAQLDATAAHDARLDDILAIDPQPHVLTIDSEPFFRTNEGWWVDDRELVELDPDDLRFEAVAVRGNLSELLDEVSIGEEVVAFATLAEFDAAHTNAPVAA